MTKLIEHLAFDLDGVIRNLIYAFEQHYIFKVKEYNFRHKGKDFWRMAKEHPEFFIDAPPTKYYKMIKKEIKCPEIWTFQHKEYRDMTEHWLAKHFDNFNVKFFNCGSDKYKYLRKQHNYILVEDTANFPDYTRVLLIDQKWNKQIKNAYRINKVKELKTLIKGINK